MIPALLTSNFIFIFALIYQNHKLKERVDDHDDTFRAVAKYVELSTEQIKYCRHMIDGESTEERIQ